MDYTAHLQGFVTSAQSLLDHHYAKDYHDYPQGQRQILEVRIGKRYAKIISPRYGAWAFVDMTNGDILKPASFAAPAKYARGSITAPDYGISCCTVFGPAYLR